MAAKCVEAIYNSPEPAARETAATICDAIGKIPVQVYDLREVECQPSLDDAALLRCFELGPAELFARRPRWDSLPGFEASRAFRLRVVQALEAIIGRHSARRVVVVTHTSVINAYLSMVLDIPRDVFFAPDYASLTTLRVSEGQYALQGLNDTSHLASGKASSGLLPSVKPL
jgi:broad specificity phosphatase PhoE